MSLEAWDNGSLGSVVLEAWVAVGDSIAVVQAQSSRVVVRIHG